MAWNYPHKARVVRRLLSIGGMARNELKKFCSKHLRLHSQRPSYILSVLRLNSTQIEPLALGSSLKLCHWELPLARGYILLCFPCLIVIWIHCTYIVYGVLFTARHKYSVVHFAQHDAGTGFINRSVAIY